MIKNGSVTLDNTEMDYAAFGKGDQYLVVLPGLSDGLATVKGKVLILAAPFRAYFKDYTVYMFSRKNRMPEGYSIRDMAEDQVRVMWKLGIKKACVLGVSQGGMIAQYMAIDHPETVSRLILAVTAPYANETAARTVKSWIRMAEHGDHRALMTDTAEKMYSKKYLAANRKYLPLLAKVTKPKSYERFYRNAEAILQFDARAELSSVRCPVLILAGSEDQTIGKDAAMELKQYLPQAEMYVYEGLGHGAYEEGKDFYDRVLAFCRRPDKIKSSGRSGGVDMLEKTYTTACGTIHYWVNAMPSWSGPELVFLPGLTADHRLFDKQIEHFASSYRVLVWDAPEHAASWPFESSFDLEDKAVWLDEILQQEQMNHPVIIGQSMGGYVGQMYAQLYPEKLKGFVSIDSAPLQREYVTSAEIYLLKKMEPVYRYYPWKALLKTGTEGVAVTPYGRQLMYEMMMTYSGDQERYARISGHGFKMLAEAMEKDLPYEICCPAILICGDHDQAGSCKHYSKAWHKKTGIPLYWIKDAGHNANTDQPGTVNYLIEKLLTAVKEQMINEQIPE